MRKTSFPFRASQPIPENTEMKLSILGGVSGSPTGKGRQKGYHSFCQEIYQCWWVGSFGTAFQPEVQKNSRNWWSCHVTTCLASDVSLTDGWFYLLGKVETLKLVVLTDPGKDVKISKPPTKEPLKSLRKVNPNLAVESRRAKSYPWEALGGESCHWQDPTIQVCWKERALTQQFQQAPPTFQRGIRLLLLFLLSICGSNGQQNFTTLQDSSGTVT